MKERTIKSLGIIIKALFVYSWIFFFNLFTPPWDIFCFGKSINAMLLYFPLILLVVFELVIFLKRKKKGLLNKKPSTIFSEFVVILIILFISPVIMIPCCGGYHRGRTEDARRIAALNQIHASQERFYLEQGRYANSLEELKETDYLSSLENLNIIFEKDTDSDTWKAYAYINLYEHEICSRSKKPNIFICNEIKCWQEYIR